MFGRQGFAKVELQPGETRTVSIALDFRAFAFYDPLYRQWVTEDGEFDILIGSSSDDIHFIETVSLRSTLDLPCMLDKESTIGEWLADPRGKIVFTPVFENMRVQMAGLFGGEGEGDSSGIGMDAAAFMMDMPLGSLLHFQENRLEKSSDEIVEELLVKVHSMR